MKVMRIIEKGKIKKIILIAFIIVINTTIRTMRIAEIYWFRQVVTISNSLPH